MTNLAAKTRIMEVAWQEMLRDIYSMKSLKYYSIRNEMWELPDHITDNSNSIALCLFRTGNAGLGHRMPLEGLNSQLKLCPFCSQGGTAGCKLDERHVLFKCKNLVDL